MNTDWLVAIRGSVLLVPLIAYLLGSIPFGFLLVKARRGRDIRSAGSGNIGAANVARNAGFALGALTLLLDAGKGYLAVWLAAHWHGAGVHWMAGAAALAVAGHVFPIWLGFRGGKGVATALGAFAAICPEAIVAAVVVWILIAAFWRYSSAGSMVAIAALPVLIYGFYAPPHAPPLAVTAAAVAVSLLVLAKHRGNLQRLMAGEEKQLFRRKDREDE